MSIKVKKIGTLVVTKILSTEIYGEIVNVKNENGITLYDVLLDNGDIKSLRHYELTSITKGNEKNHMSARKSLSENPLKYLHKSVSLSLEMWESILNKMSVEEKNIFRPISSQIQETKDIYKLK